MGYKNLRTLSEIKRLYEKTKKATKNFSEMKEETLEESPEILTIIRLALGLTQRNFSKAIGITRASLAHYELGNKFMKASRKIHVAGKLNEMISKIKVSEETVLSNFNHLWSLAKNGQDPNKLRELGRSAVLKMKPTLQESNILNLLESKKIDFQKGALVNLNSMRFSFDFVMPNAEDPKILVECKSMNIKSKKTARIVYHKMGFEIAYKFRLAQARNPEIKRIFILNTNHENLPQRVFSILKSETDFLLINPNEKEILNCLKSF